MSIAEEWAEKIRRYAPLTDSRVKPNPKGAASADVAVQAEGQQVLRLLSPQVPPAVPVLCFVLSAAARTEFMTGCLCRPDDELVTVRSALSSWMSGVETRHHMIWQTSSRRCMVTPVSLGNLRLGRAWVITCMMRPHTLPSRCQMLLSESRLLRSPRVLMRRLVKPHPD